MLHGFLAAGTDIWVQEVARRIVGERYVAVTVGPIYSPTQNDFNLSLRPSVFSISHFFLSWSLPVPFSVAYLTFAFTVPFGPLPVLHLPLLLQQLAFSPCARRLRHPVNQASAVFSLAFHPTLALSVFDNHARVQTRAG